MAYVNKLSNKHVNVNDLTLTINEEQPPDRSLVLAFLYEQSLDTGIMYLTHSMRVYDYVSRLLCGSFEVALYG